MNQWNILGLCGSASSQVLLFVGPGNIGSLLLSSEHDLTGQSLDCLDERSPGVLLFVGPGLVGFVSPSREGGGWDEASWQCLYERIVACRVGLQQDHPGPLLALLSHRLNLNFVLLLLVFGEHDGSSEAGDAQSSRVEAGVGVDLRSRSATRVWSGVWPAAARAQTVVSSRVEK